MISRNRRLLLLIATAAVLCGCGRPSVIYYEERQKHDYVVAEIDTIYQITMSDLYEAINRTAELKNGGILDTAAVRQFLVDRVCDTLAGLEGGKVDLTKHYEFHRTFKNRYNSLLVRRFLQVHVYDRVIIDSQAVADFYFEREDLFSLPEQILVSHILISPKALAEGPDSLSFVDMAPEQVEQAAGDQARHVKSLIDGGTPFDSLATEYSHDMYSNLQGGHIGWVGKGHYLDPFDSIAFSLTSGEVSEPYLDSIGYHILWIEKYLPAGVPELDSNQYSVAYEAYGNYNANRIGGTLYDSLMSQPVDIVYNDSALQVSPYELEKQATVAVVNGTDTIDALDMRGAEDDYRSTFNLANTTLEMKRQMIQEMSRSIVMLQAARAARIDTLPDIVSKRFDFWQAQGKILAQGRSQDHRYKVSDSAIEAYYQTHLEDYLVEKPLRLQTLTVADSAFGEFLRDQANSGYSFDELKSLGGNDTDIEVIDLGDLDSLDVPAPVWQVAIVTPEKGVSRPFLLDGRYCLLKVVKRHQSRDLGIVSPSIRTLLTRQHQREVFVAWRDDVYRRYNVTYPRPVRPIHLRPVGMR